MSRAMCLTARKPLVQTAACPGSPPENGRFGDNRRIGHALKNCVSALLLGLATLDRNGEEWNLPERTREVFEGLVLEMNGLVDEWIESAR